MKNYIDKLVMGKYLIFIACLLLTNVLMAQSELTIEQREKAEM